MKKHIWPERIFFKKTAKKVLMKKVLIFFVEAQFANI